MTRTEPNASPPTGDRPTPAQRRADALRRAARAKQETAAARAEAAIRQLAKNQREINFRAVAREGRVSLDFLYANTGLRGRIESLRAQQTTPTPTPSSQTDPGDSDGNLVHVLTVKLREERTRRRALTHDLEQQLAAHGEIVRLRRLLQQHGLRA